ncbi:hypothetical protein ASU31_02680 [Pedobacter ginsenosidimutans]|uniref:MoxR-vWA-beta-propeller ternary system domain-containing protein n=1 Tax=Pedobacter ginsenosidimutans TaxID=687842 RepID=A0A0T5VUB8_9SPHI|nr:hypothetical protein [Pedobacter ginsenosidimutans]KRT17468.1 hypothetical protein ASU31_02680 [Pedobacter ginsenosidimutans]
MKLQLRYQAKSTHAIWGAYLPGSPADWFAEMANWSVDFLSIKAYLVPESVAQNNCIGLFVVFGAAIPKSDQIRYPYTQVTEGFFIPVNAKLFPELPNSELSAAKLWDVQFFHPNIGLVGFEQQDSYQLADLIETPETVAKPWLHNLPLAPVLPQLCSVMIEPLQTTDAIDDLKALINTQPLSDIPKTEEDQKHSNKWSNMLKPLSNLGFRVLLGFAFIGKFLLQIIAFLFPKQAASMANIQTPSFLQQLDAWINQKMASIEKQRDSELNRLVKLFDKDKDAALQYAIPLNSAYLNRGTAAPSGKLSRQSLNLNFKNFGNGLAADVWDLGSYRWELQQRYEKTATQAIIDRDFKKAAYVYAHLLGDLDRAARTLQDGKHYREAAAIYKDHLNNKNLAAGCLEKGGLLNEAINLYVDLANYEKVGDLYVQMGQKQQALKYYEDVVLQSLGARDHLKAASIIELKIGDPKRSEEVLLNGWHNNNQAEQCLKHYFEIKVQNGIPLNKTVNAFYTEQLSKGKSTVFLRVLANVAENSEDDSFRETALNICYEIVSQQTAAGDFSALKMMDRFMHQDPMIVQDINRYTINHYKEIKQQQADYYIQLDREIKWVDFCSFHDQLIGIGIKNETMQLLRMKWEDCMDYLYLFKADIGEKHALIADAGISNRILISGDTAPSEHRKLPETHDFEREIVLSQISWLGQNMAAAIEPTDQKTLSVLLTHGEDIRLNRYTVTGQPLTSVVCTWDKSSIDAYHIFSNKNKMYWRKNHLYFTGSDMLVRAADTGILEMLFVESPIINFSVSSVHTALKIAVLTTDGCLVVNPTLKEMPISIPLFATDLSAHCIQILPDNHLVVANSEKARVYDISGKKAQLLFEVITDHDIIRIFNVPKRHHFGLLEADNRISVHIINKEE